MKNLFPNGIPESKYVAGFRPHCEEHCDRTYDDVKLIRQDKPCTNHNLENFDGECWECYLEMK